MERGATVRQDNAAVLLDEVLRVLGGRVAASHDERVDVSEGHDVVSDGDRALREDGSCQSGFCGRPRMPIATANVFERYVAAAVSTRKKPARGRIAATASPYRTTRPLSSIARSRYVSVSPLLASVRQRTPVQTAARPL